MALVDNSTRPAPATQQPQANSNRLQSLIAGTRATGAKPGPIAGARK